MEVYFDNSATTKVSTKAAAAVLKLMTEDFGNPSSLHSKGLEAEHHLTAARRIIAASIGATESEVIFTSGGTEANNLAVFGAAHARAKRGNRIVTTAAEHSSVLESCMALEKEGFEVIYINPDSDGHISVESIEDAVDKKTILVSVMAVNNETGAIFPVDSIARIIKRKNAPALFHIDAVQAYGKIPLKTSSLGCDLMTVSSHKIHGPKGCGALFIKKGVYIKPLLYGGEQEKKIRPGTEALPLIVGFAKAAEEIGDFSRRQENAADLRDYILTELTKTGGVFVNSPNDALPYILNISVVGIRSETMLHYLEKRGVYISSGSACAKGKKSHVLKAMGLDAARADSALRISFSSDSTKEQADILIKAIKEGMTSLVKAN
ncbi:MAG: cysteine desulfurase [Clostridia bacterium]|nr:cysteine desulfurase [Clostridia bacterium]